MANKCENVLIVEDDEFLLKIFKIKFEKEGFTVKIAENGDIAMNVLKTFIPDIILLDLVMPKKDGFETLSEIKADSKLKKIPVIVLTNLGQDSDKEKVAEFGVKDYLVKADIPIEEAVEKVKEVCSRKA